MRDGLIPNMFPEGEREGLYHTADATLWFFHALAPLPRGDRRPRDARAACCPTLADIVEHHLRGTRFGIGVDPADGLLRQGAEGYQLTWMDAKVGDWVVTPRRGKAVEINALWYNALRLLGGWLAQARRVASAEPIGAHAERGRDVVQRARFWYARGRPPLRRGGRRAAATIRPAGPTRSSRISLPTSGARSRALAGGAGRGRASGCSRRSGLRSLAPRDPDYKPTTTATCGRATPPTTRARCGPG